MFSKALLTCYKSTVPTFEQDEAAIHKILYGNPTRQIKSIIVTSVAQPEFRREMNRDKPFKVFLAPLYEGNLAELKSLAQEGFEQARESSHACRSLSFDSAEEWDGTPIQTLIPKSNFCLLILMSKSQGVLLNLKYTPRNESRCTIC